MNSKGFDIAITTIVLIIIGVAVLIGFIFFIKNGFSFFKGGTDPLLETQSLEGARQACGLVCRSENSVSYCCNPISLNGKDTLCTDYSLNVECNIDCSKVVCN
jgi:hypothetical protein